METKKFAWWPKQVTSGRWAWFVYYYQSRTLHDSSTGRPPLTNLYFVYTETEQERTWNLLKQSTIHNRNIWNDPNLSKQDMLK